MDQFKIHTKSVDTGQNLVNQFTAIGLDFSVDFEEGTFNFFVDADDFGYAIGDGALEIFAVSKDSNDGGGE